MIDPVTRARELAEAVIVETLEDDRLEGRSLLELAEAVLDAIGYDHLSMKAETMAELADEVERLRGALWEIAGLTDQYGKRPDAVIHVIARTAVDPPATDERGEG